MERRKMHSARQDMGDECVFLKVYEGKEVDSQSFVEQLHSSKDDGQLGVISKILNVVIPGTAVERIPFRIYVY